MINPGVLIVLALVVAAVPVIAGLFTAYLKVSVVFGIVRNGFSLQQVPSPSVIVALSLAITLIINGPVFEAALQRVDPSLVQELIKQPSLEVAQKIAPAFEPWRDWMIGHCGERELRLLRDLKGEFGPTEKTPPLSVLLPAFVLSELKEGFAIGFILLLPFLAIDIIVANLLVGLGMSVVSPTTITLPLKLLAFISIDGWLLITKGLVASYGGAVGG